MGALEAAIQKNAQSAQSTQNTQKQYAQTPPIAAINQSIDELEKVIAAHNAVQTQPSKTKSDPRL